MGQRVAERTSELGVANEELRKEIADRKQIGTELRESQQQYELMVHSIDGIVWEVNAETFRFTFVSKQAERILGYPLAKWFEPNFWADHLHPDDRDWAVGFSVDAIPKERASAKMLPNKVPSERQHHKFTRQSRISKPERAETLNRHHARHHRRLRAEITKGVSDG